MKDHQILNTDSTTSDCRFERPRNLPFFIVWVASNRNSDGRILPPINPKEKWFTIHRVETDRSLSRNLFISKIDKPFTAGT